MSYYTYIPKPPLSAFIGLLWLYEGSDPAHSKERVLPDGSIQLVFNLQADKLQIYEPHNHSQFESFGGSVVCGPHSDFFVIDTASQKNVMGVHFKPGGAFPFFQWPVGELRGLHVSLEALWGRKVVALREQLLEAATPTHKFRILESFLMTQLARPLARHPAVEFALRQFQTRPPLTTIASVTEQIGLSHRRFIELFNQEVGLTPKLFWRVRRFQAVLELIRRNTTEKDGKSREIQWSEIALSCGYFDQAHFIHDFQLFSGLNPTAYLATNTTHHNHVPLPD